MNDCNRRANGKAEIRRIEAQPRSRRVLVSDKDSGRAVGREDGYRIHTSIRLGIALIAATAGGGGYKRSHPQTANNARRCHM
jgi:hypothetical protein